MSEYQEGQTATNPKTGQKVVFRGGQWVNAGGAMPGGGGGGRANVTPKVREEAIAGFKAAEGLDRSVAELRQLYESGPGATKGVAGLADYNPFGLANQRFDRAGNSARGYVGQALGFTGGQLNTAREAEMAVGPYLPQASDRDEVAQDKITRLAELAQQARERSIAVLGGVPDEVGNIQPIDQPTPEGAAAIAAAPNAPSPVGLPPTPPGGTPPPAGGSGPVIQPGGGPAPMALSGNSGFKTTNNPARAGVNARVNKMLQGGASDAQVQAYLASIGAPGAADATLAFRKQNPTYKGAYLVDLERMQVPLSTGQTVLNAVGAGPTGAYFTNAADALTAGTLDNMTANPAMTRAIQEGIRQQNPTASLAGMVSGGALAAGGLEMGLGAAGARLGGAAGRLLANPLTADAVYGAATGAGSADEGSRLAGAVVGSLAGAGGGIGGRAAGRGLGGMFAGVRNPDVQALRARGVPLTVGQTLGGVAKTLEDASTSIPLVGNVINARRLEGIEGFNRAALNEGVAPLARQSNPLAVNVTGTGENGVEAMRAIREQGYANALGGRTAMRDPAQMMDFDAARQAAGAIPNTGPQVQAELDAVVPGYFDNGMMTGENARAAVSELRGLRSARKNDPLPKRTGDAVRAAENSVLGMFERQSPGFTNDLAQANLVNGNLKTIEKATQVAGRNDGLFTPAQLDRAAQVGAGKYGGNAATSARPFFELSRAGQHVLPSAINDSGTATRAAVMGGLGLTGIGGAGYAAGGTEGAGTGTAATLGLGAALALGGTKTGQRALVKLLTDRPDFAIRIGEGIQNRARIGGMFGAGALPSLLPVQ